MSTPAIIFTLCAGLIGFTYFGYALLVWLIGQALGEPVCPVKSPPRAVSIVVAAYNEAGTIVARIVELRRLLAGLDPSSEIIVVSDGSTDGTERLAREAGETQVRVIQLATNQGKAAALNAGVAEARNPIVVFGDARQKWAPDAIAKMLENYGDPDVGAVSGDLELTREDGSLAGVGLYWRLEKWVRRGESLLFASVGVTGAICSVRRELYVPLPAGVILDDVCWPLSVAMQRRRVVHDSRAQAFDCLPTSPRDEIRRKIRTLSGNLQLLVMRPGIVLPWRNPIWLNLICHKLLRLLVPWAMIGALLACALPAKGAEPWLGWMLWLQVAGYVAGVLGLVVKPLARLPIVNAASSLLVLNAAAFMAWFVFLSGGCGKSWKKVAYNRTNQSPANPITAT
jgi:cellulose synthase/poly-beta-1,6-N-acetylglucosamine synthase-like glycosyltransferase